MDVPDRRDFPDEARRQMEAAEARITTTVDIRPVLSRKRAALLSHASQISDSWFSKIPPDVAEQVFGQESFIRAMRPHRRPGPRGRPVRRPSLSRAAPRVPPPWGRARFGGPPPAAGLYELLPTAGHWQPARAGV